jgi:hypothetical protein
VTDARDILEDSIDALGLDDTLNKLVKASLAVTKKARGWCPACKKQVWVEIEDAKAAVQALEILLNQAKGRPQQADSDNDEKITLVRREYV